MYFFSSSYICCPVFSFCVGWQGIGQKRMKTEDAGRTNNGMEADVTKHNTPVSLQKVTVTTVDEYLGKKYCMSNIIDYSDPSSVSYLMDELDHGKFGSVTREIEALIALRMEILNPLYTMFPDLLTRPLNGVETEENDTKVIDVDVVDETKKAILYAHSPLPVVIVDSDEESSMYKKPSYPFQQIFLGTPAAGFLFEDPMVIYSFYNF